MTAPFNTESAIYCPAATPNQFGTTPQDLTDRSTPLTLSDSNIWNPGALCSDTASFLFDNTQFHNAELDWTPERPQHWTVAFWVSIENFNSVSSGTDDFLPLWYMGTGIASPNPGFDFFTGLGFVKTTGELVVRLADATHQSISGGVFVATPGSYGWRHFAATCDDVTGTITIYHNGTQVGTAAIAGPSYTPATSPFVGGVQDPPGTAPALSVANHFSGHIGEARFFDYPLIASEIQDLADNRNYAPLQPTIQVSAPYQQTTFAGSITSNEVQKLQFSSGSTPTFQIECDATLPASYTVADMQTAVNSLYSSNRRAPQPVDIDLEHAPSLLNAATPALDEVEYLLEFDPTNALPTGYTQISDVTGPVQVRLSYRSITDSARDPITGDPTSPVTVTGTRAHVFFRVLNSQLITAAPNITYSNSTTPASAPTAQVTANASRVLAFALHPSSFDPGNTTLDDAYDFFGQITPNTGVTTQRISVFSSKRHRNTGASLVPGNAIPESLPAKGVWVAIPLAPDLFSSRISVTGSDLDYTFTFRDVGPQPFIPFVVDASTTYAPPTFLPLVQDPNSPFLRERPFATTSADATPGALPLLDSNGQLDLTLFENVPQTVQALSTDTIAAGSAVEVYDNAGTTEVRLADNTPRLSC